MLITAHRGLSSVAPENTLAAIQKAIELGAKSIEIDVQISKDGVPIVFHDFTVNRCTNGQGLVQDIEYSELAKLDAGLWFSDEFENEKIPTLAEVLILIRQNGITLNIELKVQNEAHILALCKQVVEVIEASKITTGQLVFSSFEHQALLLLKRLKPSIRRSQLWEKIPDNALQMLDDIYAFSVNCDYRFLRQEQALIIKQAGYQLHCYTVNDPLFIEPLRPLHVDNIITDWPQRF